MEIEQTNDQYIIKLPKSVNIEGLQELINYLTYKEAISKSESNQEDIDSLVTEIKSNWWKINRQRLTNENNH